MSAPGELNFSDGEEWIIDAFGCRPEALRDSAGLQAIFEQVDPRELELNPLGSSRGCSRISRTRRRDRAAVAQRIASDRAYLSRARLCGVQPLLLPQAA